MLEKRNSLQSLALTCAGVLAVALLATAGPTAAPASAIGRDRSAAADPQELQLGMSLLPATGRAQEHGAARAAHPLAAVEGVRTDAAGNVFVPGGGGKTYRITPDGRIIEAEAEALAEDPSRDVQTAPLVGGPPCDWADDFFVADINGLARSAVVFDDGTGPALYVGGSFLTASAVIANHIAKWDGSVWSALGSGLAGSTVNALTVFDDGGGDALYAGGSFATAGGAAAANIAKWDGSVWSPLGSGMDSSTHTLMVFNDGSGDALYAGGVFTTAGGVAANRIAKWDGSFWSPLGSGMDIHVWALTVFNDGSGDALYAGGAFTTAGGVAANGIARWDGGTWSPLGSGANSPTATTLMVFNDGGGDALYVGGHFTTAGGVAANRIARWDGSSWSALGSGIGTSGGEFVEGLAVFDDGGGNALYAGGRFTTAGGVSAVNMARWDGSTWSPLNSGLTGGFSPAVYTLSVFNDGGGSALYAVGRFTNAGGEVVSNIAQWDGSSWSRVDSVGHNGFSRFAARATVFDDGSGDALYVGGDFSTAGGIAANRIARWDGNTWSPLGSGMNNLVLALTVFNDGGGDALYASGRFTTAGGVSAIKIAKWDGSVWSPLGSGMDGVQVEALTVFNDGGGDALYAGGFFTTAGGVPAMRIARWDGSVWSPLGSGVDDPILSEVWGLTVFNDGGGDALYVCGRFDTAGGSSANNIARWNGSTWSSLGSGMNSIVLALTVFNDGGGDALYAGGFFSTAGGTAANRIARWDGSVWSPLGSGMNSDVVALAVFNDGGGDALYAGGRFTTAGGTVADRIAKWDGSVWSPLGSGVGANSNEFVNGLTVFNRGGDALYAFGNFTSAGGKASTFIAKYGCGCPADVDGDGDVGPMDLAILLGNWGPTVPCPPFNPSDFDTDCDVDAADLAQLLGAWGACE